MAKGGTESPATSAEPYQGLLSGSQWMPGVLTYSFPDSAADYGRGYSETNKFQAFSSSEQTAFKSVIAQVESFTPNLEFVQITGSNDGSAQIRIGKTVKAGADAWAYYPGGGKGGDAWFDKGLNGSFGGKGGMNWGAIEHGKSCAYDLTRGARLPGAGAKLIQLELNRAVTQKRRRVRAALTQHFSLDLYGIIVVPGSGKLTGEPHYR